MNEIVIFDKAALSKEIKLEAKALGIPVGAAEVFIKKSVDGVGKKLSNRKIITNKDLERAVYTELKKYNADLAYVCKNRDKIF